MTKENKECPCPEGQVRDKFGKCVMPEITFTGFIMSFHTSALFHLGELAHPETGQKKQDLGLAKHTIDTLVLLEKKTNGNLNDNEKQLLTNILYELKMRFVQANKENATESSSKEE